MHDFPNHSPVKTAASDTSSDGNMPGTDPDLLDHLVKGSLGPLSKLRETVDSTVQKVSRWIEQPFNRQQIANLVTLLDAQTQLIICQQRLVAVARLVDVAMNAPGHETVRRACADLLRTRLVDPYREDKRPVRMPPAVPIGIDEVRDALEKLGNVPELDVHETADGHHNSADRIHRPNGESIDRNAAAPPSASDHNTNARATQNARPNRFDAQTNASSPTRATNGKRPSNNNARQTYCPAQPPQSQAPPVAPPSAPPGAPPPRTTPAQDPRPTAQDP